MNTIVLEMDVVAGQLTIRADNTDAGTQYEHNVSRFLFVRNCAFAQHNLIFATSTSRGMNWRDVELPLVNIGQENELLISDFMTQGTILKLQIILRQGSNDLRSNTLEFTLRPSLPRPGQSVYGDLLAKVFASADILEEVTDTEVTKFLVFSNALGEELSRVVLSKEPVEEPEEPVEEPEEP